MDLFSSERITKIVLLLVVGYPAIYILAIAIENGIRRHYTVYSANLLRRTVLYLGMGILTVDILREMDFKLTALLGSAGIAGMAIGFAFKTSISNIISGLFVAFESPFSVGDYIQVDQMRGEVLSFDLLAVKIRSSENNYIRIPNEQLIKTPVINFTRFDTHRIDIKVSVGYEDDLKQVEEILLSIASDDPMLLSEPSPSFRFGKFDESSIQLTLRVWTDTKDYRQAKNTLAHKIVIAFDKNSLTMPYPRIVLDTDKILNSIEGS